MLPSIIHPLRPGLLFSLATSRSWKTMQAMVKFCSALICAALAIVSCRRPIPAAADREAIASAVHDFHEALARGERAAVLSLLAPDAQIVEMGHHETREEYENGHLAADIEFAKAVRTTPGTMIVRQEGTVAWTTLTGRSTGRFQGREVDSENAELMVLTKTKDGWRIRGIHWSSHSQIPAGH